MTPTEAEDQFRNWLFEHACPDGMEWAKELNLQDAWRTCEVGGWMAYWLRTGCGVPCRSLVMVMGSENFGYVRVASAALNLRTARRLRKAFTADGRLR